MSLELKNLSIFFLFLQCDSAMSPSSCKGAILHPGDSGRSWTERQTQWFGNLMDFIKTKVNKGSKVGEGSTHH